MTDSTVTVVGSYRVLSKDRAEVVTAIDGLTDQIRKVELDLTEKAIRQALIDMGWTPPESNNE